MRTVEPHLTSSQVERVLRRASDLARTQPAPPDDTADGISERALLAAAEEAGIPSDAVQRSLAIERLGQPVEPTAGDRLVGPRIVTVDVEMAMSVPEAMSRLDAWLAQGHHLRRERWSTYEAEWGRRDGVAAAGSRAVRSAMGEGALGDVNRLRVVARETATGCVLRLNVDRHGERAVWIAGGSVLGAVGVGGAVVTTLALGPFFVVLAPVGVAVGAGFSRLGRSQAAGTGRELERVLAAVAGRQQPATIRANLTKWVHSRHGARRRDGGRG